MKEPQIRVIERENTALGIVYELGRGVHQDTAAAIKWYDLSAQQGDVDAQMQLARIFDVGELVPRNPTAAAKYYQQAERELEAERLGKGKKS